MNKSINRNIDAFRKNIDDIDEKILELINERLSVADEIGKIKKKGGTLVLDTSREKMIFQRLLSLNKGPISPDRLHHIFAEIIAVSRGIQTPWIISYLGPEAEFTHTAAMNHFGHSVSFLQQDGIRDVFHEVARGACRYGVVPIENSTEGTLNNTLDLFLKSNLKICAELYRQGSYDLLSRGTGSIKELHVIFSDKRAISQCRKWLKRNLVDIRLEKCLSTSKAVQKALKEPGSAAVAGKDVGQLYQMDILESNIEDTPHNITRFLVIGRDAVPRTGNDKTSIMFVTPHIPGGLHRVLNPIAQAGINMVKLESRPTRNENWQYLFFADLEGHIEDKVIEDTVSEMKGICLHLKFLGSYPRAITSY